MKPPHVHRFQIPMANGSEYLEGRCKCGARKSHRAWEPEPRAAFLNKGSRK